MKGGIESAPAISTSPCGSQGLIGHVLIARQVGPACGVDPDPDFREAIEEIMRPGGDKETNVSVAEQCSAPTAGTNTFPPAG